MREYVTDTHSILWYIFKNKRLSSKALTIFEKTDVGEFRIFVPNIVLVELVYLVEKVKIPQKSIEKVINLLDVASTNYRLTQISIDTIRALQSIPRQIISDMPDRIIAATALEFELPLITRDRKITEADIVEIVW